MLNILAGCAVGRANITTVEAKIQSLYYYDHVLYAIADPKAHIDVKIACMNLFFEAYIEVEIKITDMNNSKNLWDVFKILPDMPKIMSGALLSGDMPLDEMRKVMHFVHLSANVMDAFLEHYYEGTEFRGDEKSSAEEGDGKSGADGDEKKSGVHWVDQCLTDFYHSLKELYDLKSPMVTSEQNKSMYRAMDSIAMATDQLNPQDLPLHIDILLGDDDDSEDGGDGTKDDEVHALARFLKSLDADEELQDTVKSDRTEHMVKLIDDLPRLDDDVVAEIRYEPTIKKLVQHIRNLIKKEKNRKWIERDCVDTAIWVIQLFRAMIETKWTESFREREGPDADRMGIDERDEDGEEEEDEAAGPVQDTLDECGATILCLEVIADGMNEKVVEEGVKLIIALLFREGGNKVTQSTIFNHLNQKGTDAFFEEIRNRLRKMIEWHQFKVVEQEDEAKEKMRATGGISNNESGEDEGFKVGDEVKASLQKKSMSGMPSKKWSEDKFAATIEKVHEEEKNGELSTYYDIKYAPPQNPILSRAANSFPPFARRYTASGETASKVMPKYIEEEEEDVDEPDGIILIRGIQLMSEGHFEGNQDMVRDQPNNSKSYNLLDDFVNYLAFLSKNSSPESTNAASMVADTILEVIQGPCTGNQQHLAMNTELIEILNRMMRAKAFEGSDDDDEEDLKKCGLEIFEALLEGQGKGSEIYERILSVIHLDVLQVMACDGAGDDEGGGEGSDDEDEGSVLDDKGEGEEEEEEEEDGLGELQTEALILMQMLCDYKPEIKAEFEWPAEIKEKLGSEIVSVEVVWHGELQRRFFPVPEMCFDLANASKDNFVEQVDRDSTEIKLIALMEAAKTMYIEIKHQQNLKELGISGVFSPGNQARATWYSFM
jgi:predicted house-cleaning noncanonical NTP pyrophosphatase (MazG superfamily)